jgi:hypothetical protein
MIHTEYMLTHHYHSEIFKILIYELMNADYY